MAVKMRAPVRSAGRSCLLAPALALAVCLICNPALAVAPVAPLCLDGQTLLVPGPEKSQLADIFASLDATFHVPGLGPEEKRFTPGRGGSYALRDLGREKTDGCRQAGLVLPSLFYLERSPGSMVDKSAALVLAVSASADNALWVARGGPLDSWPKFLARARELAGNPTIYLSIAGTGSYTDQHMATLQLNRAAGIRAEYSPLLGSEEAAEAVRTGRAAACWAYALSEDSMKGMVPLAVAGEKRSPALPETPTFRELGIELVNTAHFAFAVPASTLPKGLEELRSYRMYSGRFAAPLVPGLRRAGFEPSYLPVFLDNAARQAEADMDDYRMLPDLVPRFPAP